MREPEIEVSNNYTLQLLAVTYLTRQLNECGEGDG